MNNSPEIDSISINSAGLSSFDTKSDDMAKENYTSDLSGELSPKNALQSDFDETNGMDTDERYLVRSHTAIQHCDQR